MENIFSWLHHRHKVDTSSPPRLNGVDTDNNAIVFSSNDDAKFFACAQAVSEYETKTGATCVPSADMLTYTCTQENESTTIRCGISPIHEPVVTPVSDITIYGTPVPVVSFKNVTS